MTYPIVEKVAARFWASTEKRGETDCWPWHGPVLKDNRGSVCIDRKTITAPRLSWFIHFGHWPDDGIFVCHSCDNPNCVNPTHLWLGSNSDNLRDAGAKKRLHQQKNSEYLQGSKHSMAKLTEEDVAIIREEYAKGGISMQKLADRYGVSEYPIRMIIHRRHWKHVA